MLALRPWCFPRYVKIARVIRVFKSGSQEILSIVQFLYWHFVQQLGTFFVNGKWACSPFNCDEIRTYRRSFNLCTLCKVYYGRFYIAKFIIFPTRDCLIISSDEFLLLRKSSIKNTEQSPVEKVVNFWYNFEIIIELVLVKSLWLSFGIECAVMAVAYAHTHGHSGHVCN